MHGQKNIKKPLELFTFAQSRIKEKILLQKNVTPHAEQKVSNECSDELY